MRTRPELPLSACFAAACFLLAYPICVIRPFRYQEPRQLAAALRVTQYRPALEALCAALALLVLLSAWNRVSIRRKVAAVVLTLLVFACGLLCRINVYEKMFHPVDRPTFSTISHSKLDPNELVLAVLIKNTARAYPVRDISYHHIVNDTLAGRPIVATY
jgi:Protein of unknown function (DUF3179)